MDPRLKPKNLGLFQAYFPDPKESYMVVSRPGFQNAGVYDKFPSEVHIDPNFVNMPGIFEHEFEHQLNRQAQQRYQPLYAKDQFQVKPEIKFWYENADNFGLKGGDLSFKFRNNVQNAVGLIDTLLKEKTGEGLDPRSRLWKANTDTLPEVLAELSSIESVLNMDFTKDKKLRKSIFDNDEKFSQVYRSVTSGRQNRLDAKDLEPYTTQIQNKSLKDTILEYVDLFAKPFSDTTR